MTFVLIFCHQVFDLVAFFCLENFSLWLYFNKREKIMEIFLGFIHFLQTFMLVMSILYLLKVGYDIAKVATLQEGKVELGKYGLLMIGMSVSYIIALICC